MRDDHSRSSPSFGATLGVGTAARFLGVDHTVPRPAGAMIAVYAPIDQAVIDCARAVVDRFRGFDGLPQEHRCALYNLDAALARVDGRGRAAHPAADLTPGDERHFFATGGATR
ncbi:MAG TPA: hypothetical protein VGD10_08210 [Allosphingosinicella sp.]|uniref:hypothetical protein n=1 Tax=Allosphingosinicella sp. TaxID=2823234 RepID=UPI002EDAD353